MGLGWIFYQAERESHRQVAQVFLKKRFPRVKSTYNVGELIECDVDEHQHFPGLWIIIYEQEGCILDNYPCPL